MKIKSSDIAFNIINYMVFGLFALICVFPLYYIFILSISANDVVGSGSLVFYPQGVHFANYVNVMRIKGIGTAAMISVTRTILGTMLTLVGCSFLGYLFTKKEMYGRKFFYRMVIITMYFNAGLIPWYITMHFLHLTNNFLAYILPGTISAFYLVLFKTYLESIPAAMEESAKIDGAGYLRIFTSIMLPLATPILATIAVFESVNQWNNFTDNLLLMTNTKLDTLQLLLYYKLREVDSIADLIRQGGSDMIRNPRITLTPTALRMTITMVVVFPILLIYPFLQKYFVKGIMIGAVKG